MSRFLFVFVWVASLSGCCLPQRYVLSVKTQTYICVPPVITVIRTEYHTCGEAVSTETLMPQQQNQPTAELILK